MARRWVQVIETCKNSTNVLKGGLHAVLQWKAGFAAKMSVVHITNCPQAKIREKFKIYKDNV